MNDRARKIMKFIFARLSERTTWQGITAFLTAFGVGLAPEQVTAVVTAGVAVAGIVYMLFPEDGVAKRDDTDRG
jgi:hypothetical protein